MTIKYKYEYDNTKYGNPRLSSIVAKACKVCVHTTTYDAVAIGWLTQLMLQKGLVTADRYFQPAYVVPYAAILGRTFSTVK